MTTDPKVLIRRLKKQVLSLRRKEKAATQELKKVFSKMKVLGKAYERKAAANLKKMKTQMMKAQVGAYLKTAGEVERQVRQKVAAKQEMLGQILARVEKHFGAKTLPKKAKRARKAKASSKKRSPSRK